MTYAVDCPCGTSIAVTASQAGSDVTCACGRTVRVPRLSELRSGAGLAAFESGPADTVRSMLQSGELPWGNVCAVSGAPTFDVLELYVECERTYVRGRHSPLVMFFVALYSPIIGLLMLKSRQELFGRDTYIRTPLRVDKACQGRLLRNAGQRKLRRLLRTVPAYEKLLDAYPRARVFVGFCPEPERMKVEQVADLSSSGDPSRPTKRLTDFE